MNRMSAADYRAMIAKKPKPNKYGAVPAWRCERCAAEVVWGGAKCVACGCDYSIRFPSQAEARRYDLLVSMQRMGLITDLRIQVPFEITIEGEGLCRYLADFVYFDAKKRRRVEDVKSPASRTPMYRLKKKAMRLQHGIEIEEIVK